MVAARGTNCTYCTIPSCRLHTLKMLVKMLWLEHLLAPFCRTRVSQGWTSIAHQTVTRETL